MSKKRVSLTLEKDIVEKIDNEADGRSLNRSSMVEEIVDGYFKRKGVDTAVVLCGGENRTSLKLYEGKPVLSHILDHLASEGINRVILLTGNNEEIIESFSSEYRGMALDFVPEQNPSGTASAIKQVEGKIGKTFVVLNGHVITDVDIKDMLRVHDEEDAEVTMALTTVENPSDYGVARLKGRKILGFEEKPEKGEEPSRLINAGTYLFEPSVFSLIEEGGLEDVFKKLADDKGLYGYIYGGDWKEV